MTGSPLRVETSALIKLFNDSRPGDYTRPDCSPCQSSVLKHPR